jgi:hypothetical protein
MPLRNKKNLSEANISGNQEFEMMPSTLETIDMALHSYLDSDLNLFTTSNEGFNKVPVVWMTPERSFQIKNDKNLRDSNGVLKLPMISLEKTSVTKNPTMHGRITAHIPPQNDARGGSITIGKRIQQEKTSLFMANDAARLRGGGKSVGKGDLYYPSNSSKIVTQTVKVPLPVYVNVNYKLLIQTEYQQQMNELLTPFLLRTGQINEFFIKHDGHQFEAFLPQEFGFENNTSDLGEDERTYKTSIDIRVLGHLMGEMSNTERPKIVVRENLVVIRQPRERVVFADVHPNKKDGQFYKE